MARSGLSIPTRIFLGYAVLCIVVVGLGVSSVRQHDATSNSLRRLHEGYLPLALTIGESKANQAVYVTLLGEILESTSSTLERDWLGIARRVRPATIRRAVHGARRLERLAESPAERRTALTILHTLAQISARFETSSAAVERLLEAVQKGDTRAASRELALARANELDAQRRLRELHLLLEERSASLARLAAEKEASAAITVGALTLGGLAIGIAMTLLSRRLLAPLPLLHARVGAVARNEASEPLAPVRNDELGRLTEEFERMLVALASRDQKLIAAERLAAIGRMAAHVTHEVRNPLSSIALNVEMLGDELPAGSTEARALLSSIHREIDRLTSITEDYLRLARVPEPRLELVSVDEFVSDVVRFVGPEMKRAGAELRFVPCDPDVEIPIDESQMRQALLNLLRNAREAMPDGGEVEVLASADADVVELRVSDRGIGMSDEQRERIFDPFFSTKTQGTGLGLPLSQQIISSHGGTIRCEPNGDAGTSFVIRLPRRPPSDKSAQA